MKWSKERKAAWAEHMKKKWANPRRAAMMRAKMAAGRRRAMKAKITGPTAKAMVRRWASQRTKKATQMVEDGFVLRGYTVTIKRADIPTLIRQLATYIE